jgi:Fur family transcriptional regulator, peroxide stress response regulator
MDPSFAEIAAKLARKNIRGSYQRIKVLEYLLANRCHPTVDQIFNALHDEIPSLSKTTIYNSLSVFQKANLIRELSIDDTEARYDVMLENHGHFKCESCGTIFNFAVKIDLLSPQDLNNFQIRDRNVYFRGICPGCLSNQNANQEKED